MTSTQWNERYLSGELPWDTGQPEEHLVGYVDQHGLPSGPILEIGSGTGTNVVWLARRGAQVTGVDLAPRAVEMATARIDDPRSTARFVCLDFLKDAVPGGPFGFAFDRGCFHVFDEAGDQARFAERVAAHLRPGGVWLSVSGSTEGPARDHGPPRRSARDLMNAVEPHLEILELRGSEFHANIPSPARAWVLIARVREVPAQPSTRR